MTIGSLESLTDDLAHDLPPEELVAGLAVLREQLRGTSKALPLDDLAATGAMHPLPWVRDVILEHLVDRHPESSVTRQLTRWLTHDYDDRVAFRAIDACGVYRDRDALSDLFLIVGRASERVSQRAGRPVGIGHALVLRAITRIVGSDDVATLAEIETALFPQEGTPATSSGTSSRVGDLTHASARAHAHDDMRYVEGGPVPTGVPPAFSTRRLLFDWSPIGGPASETTEVAPFAIDIRPITAAEYDDFAAGNDALRHVNCHPAEPRGKIHLRNTLLDPRCSGDHPATGVDWFDAYAYAASQGKRLPSATEWERACHGNHFWAYPWGDDFDPSKAHCVVDRPKRGRTALESWRRTLLGMADNPPARTTRPVGCVGSESPFGIQDMSGNVWEWTSTAFGGDHIRPPDMERDAIDIVYDPSCYAILKGGAWTSLPELASGAFRGRDLILDRHIEIGFRTVCDCVGGSKEAL